jgi:hypothetical protein
VKTVSTLRLPQGSTRADFQSWYIDDFCASRLKAESKIKRLVVNLVREKTPLSNGRVSSDDLAIYSEFWSGADDVLSFVDVTAGTPGENVYRVAELIEKNERADQIGQTPGVLQFGLCYPLKGHSREQSRFFWDRHVPLALRVHVGMVHYVRNFVEAPLSNEADSIFGIPALHFPDVASMQSQFYDKLESIPEHAEDVADFVSAARSYVAVRHVLK